MVPILAAVVTLSAIFVPCGIAIEHHHIPGYMQVPYISQCVQNPPETCWFTLLLNAGGVLTAGTIFLRHLQLVYNHQDNGKITMANVECRSKAIAGLGYVIITGFAIVANFRATNNWNLLNAGALLIYGPALIYCWLQTLFEWKLKGKIERGSANHIRLTLAFIQLSFTIMHTCFWFKSSYSVSLSPAVEWILVIALQLFLCTFAIDLKTVQLNPMAIEPLESNVKQFQQGAGDDTVKKVPIFPSVS